MVLSHRDGSASLFVAVSASSSLIDNRLLALEIVLGAMNVLHQVLLVLKHISLDLQTTTTG